MMIQKNIVMMKMIIHMIITAIVIVIHTVKKNRNQRKYKIRNKKESLIQVVNQKNNLRKK